MTANKPLAIFHHVPSAAYLWIAVLIFASSNAVTRRVTEIGGRYLVDGRNPISLCNVLFVGNACALALMLLLFRKELNQRTIQQLQRRDWIGVGVIAVLSGAIAPALIFAALDTTNVTNVVLISRLEPPLILALSVLLLHARVNYWTVIGSIVSFLGVAVIAFLTTPNQATIVMGNMVLIGNGELFAAIGAIVSAVATVLSRIYLQRVPLSLFSIVRTAIGTVIFFFVAILLYGPQHFVDVTSPFLWQWMVLYGAVIVVGGQLCWFKALRLSTPAELALANSVNPVAAIIMAYLILQEVPSSAQLMGGSIIAIGIVLSLIGTLRDLGRNRKSAPTPAQAMLAPPGFKGI